MHSWRAHFTLVEETLSRLENHPTKNQSQKPPTMNINLQPVKSALGRVEQIGERRRALETEQQELQSKIQTLTTAVAGGDAKSVNTLTIAKARAEVLPTELASLKSEFDGAIKNLRDLLPALSPQVAKAYGNELRRVYEIAETFLKTHLEDGHIIETLARQIVENSKTVRHLDYLNTRFSSGHINQPVGADLVISRAHQAIASLENA
jgi:DNA repair exonuclease SbcCD ATPase subunit